MCVALLHYFLSPFVHPVCEFDLPCTVYFASISLIMFYQRETCEFLRSKVSFPPTKMSILMNRCMQVFHKCVESENEKHKVVTGPICYLVVCVCIGSEISIHSLYRLCDTYITHDIILMMLFLHVVTTFDIVMSAINRGGSS